MIAVQLELPLVWLEPCPSFRIPIEGDRLTCAACGYWISDHEDDDVLR